MGNKSHSTLIQQNWSHPKIIISSLIDVLFVLLIWNTQVFFPMVISQPMPFLIICYAMSLTPLIGFSLSLSPSFSSTYAPLCFYVPLFYRKGNWFVWSASLNKCISTNVVPHLGLAHYSIIRHSKLACSNICMRAPIVTLYACQ